jgi:OmpA-OmpF porin, OOP family
MFTRILFGALLALVAQTAVLADASIPTKDIAGARDDPSIKRYEGSFVVSYQRESFSDFKVPLSSLEPTERRDGRTANSICPRRKWSWRARRPDWLISSRQNVRLWRS